MHEILTIYHEMGISILKEKKKNKNVNIIWYKFD